MKIFYLMVLLFAQSAIAARFKVTIEYIDHAKKEGDSHLLMLSDGQVAFVPASEKTLPPLNREYVEVELDKNNKLLSIQTLNSQIDDDRVVVGDKTSFEPTVLGSQAEAQTIFNRMNSRWRNRSQCYNRAMVWSYEEWQRSSLKSQKLFMFFTNRYIRNYNYKWWFHVTPMVNIMDGSAVAERTLDYAFNYHPLPVKTWSDGFVETKRACPRVANWSDYFNHQEEEDCFHIAVSMYYWQPRDIETKELTGVEKTDFVQSDVNFAYRQGFR